MIMTLDENFYKEEIRNDYLISADMKKVWAVELEILEQIDLICRKHDIRYFAAFGTLLGAVRHQGFIPWDDDIDLMMLRDDYARFQQIAPLELSYPYNFVGECDNGIVRVHSKVEDERTSAVIVPENYEAHQGIFVDIFPIDDLPDGSVKKNNIFRMQFEMWLGIFNPEPIMQYLADSSIPEDKYVLGRNMLSEFVNMKYADRVKLFNSVCESNFGESDTVGYLAGCLKKYKANIKRYYFGETLYVPFENTTIPIPKYYDEILTDRYGDYMKPVRATNYHGGCDFDVNNSYKNRKNNS